MAIKTTVQETINALNAIFDKHKNDRICILEIHAVESQHCGSKYL
jgi:hypothetical protein